MQIKLFTLANGKNLEQIAINIDRVNWVKKSTVWDPTSSKWYPCFDLGFGGEYISVFGDGSSNVQEFVKNYFYDSI